MSNQTSMLFLGAGYTAQTMMKIFPTNTMWGTTRSDNKKPAIAEAGATPIIFSGTESDAVLGDIIARVEHILISISPDKDGDICLRHHARDFKRNKNIKWIGYLSTVGVYGHHDGAWVDEEAETRPGSERSRWRKLAEDQWLKFGKDNNLPIHIFRLPGIYGKGRGPVSKLRAGTARRIEKKGQVFNRAHVEDIASILEASCRQPNPGQIYNIADDKPAPPQEVLLYAAELMGIEPPKLIPFEQAEMSQMAKSFYSDNKRVSNKRIKSELAITLKYPTYIEGIKACLDAEDQD